MRELGFYENESCDGRLIALQCPTLMLRHISQSSGIHYCIAASPSQKQPSASSVSAMHLERGVESDDIFNQYD